MHKFAFFAISLKKIIEEMMRS